MLQSAAACFLQHMAQPAKPQPQPKPKPKPHPAVETESRLVVALCLALPVTLAALISPAPVEVYDGGRRRKRTAPPSRGEATREAAMSATQDLCYAAGMGRRKPDPEELKRMLAADPKINSQDSVRLPPGLLSAPAAAPPCLPLVPPPLLLAACDAFAEREDYGDREKTEQEKTTRCRSRFLINVSRNVHSLKLLELYTSLSRPSYPRPAPPAP